MSKGTPFTREIVDRLDDLETDIDAAVVDIEAAATLITDAEIGEPDDTITAANLSDIASTSVHAKLGRIATDVVAGGGTLTEVETSTLDAGDGAVGDNERTGKLVRYIADNLGAGVATEVETTSITGGNGSILDNSRLGLLVRYIGDTVTTILANLGSAGGWLYNVAHNIPALIDKMGDDTVTVKERFDDIDSAIGLLSGAEVETTSLDATEGSIGDNDRAGLLIRYIADNLGGALPPGMALEATLGLPADGDIATDIANVQAVVDALPTVVADVAGTAATLHSATDGLLATIQSHINHFGFRQIATGTFTTESTTVPADTGRTEANGYFDSCWIVPLANVEINQPRQIASYANAGGVFTMKTGTTWITAPSGAYAIWSNGTGKNVMGLGIFTTSSASVPADTRRGEVTGYWNGCQLMPLTGDAGNQPRNIASFTTGTGVFGLPSGALFTTAPGLVNYAIVRGTQDQVPAIDTTSALTYKSTIGNKSDTAQTTVGTTRSIIAYVKGLLNQIAGLITAIGTSADTHATTTSLHGVLDKVYDGVAAIPTTAMRGTDGAMLATEDGSSFDAIPVLVDLPKLEDAVYFKTGGTDGTTWPTGTAQDPSGDMTDVLAMCGTRNTTRIIMTTGTTLIESCEEYTFIGVNNGITIDLGSQDADGSHFYNCTVTGTQGGTGVIYLHNCVIGTIVNFNIFAYDCYSSSTITPRSSSTSMFSDITCKGMVIDFDSRTAVTIHIFGAKGAISSRKSTDDNNYFGVWGVDGLTNTSAATNTKGIFDSSGETQFTRGGGGATEYDHSTYGRLGLAGYTGDGGAAQDDSIKAALDIIDNFVDGIEAKTDLILPGTKFATKTSTSHLTSGSIFSWTGSIGIVSIIGRVTTALEAATPQTIKLTCTPDALSATDLCATKDANAFGVGSLLTITGTLADAMIGTTLVGCAVSQASMITCTCVTSGVISTVFGTSGSKDGVIVWEILWIPLTPTSTLVAA